MRPDDPPAVRRYDPFLHERTVGAIGIVFVTVAVPRPDATGGSSLRSGVNQGNHDVLCPACRGGVACVNARCGRERSRRVPDSGTVNGMRSPVRAITGAGACAIATRPQSTKGIAEPRRAAVLVRLAACRRYDFLTAPTSGVGAVPWRTSIASPSAAHARYIGDARTKAGLQEVRKNC